MAAKQMGRVPELDGIRSIAVLIVMISHGGLDRIVPGGFGVTVFFFLSGYLITSLLRAENAQRGTISLYNFYLRRVLRIVPPLYLTLIFGLVLAATGLVRVSSIDPFTAFSQFTFFQNYASLWGDPPAIPITAVWSLGVEEHYYLVFPMLYLFLLRKLPAGRQVAICLALCVVALGFRFLNVAILPDYGVNYEWTHTRIDSILFGACLALRGNPAMDEGAWRPRGWQALGALGVLLLTLVIRNPVFRETLRYTLQGGALYVLFAYVVAGRGAVASLLSSRPTEVIARYSYTLYLCHVPIMKVVWQAGGKAVPHLIGSIIAVGLAFLYAMAMYRFVEVPLGRLRHRLHREKVGDLEPSIQGMESSHAHEEERIAGDGAAGDKAIV